MKAESTGNPLSFLKELEGEIVAKPQKVRVSQGSKEWLALRMGKITGSKIATAVGLNPYQSRRRLWEEMTGRREVRDIGNLPAPAWGTKYEGEARAAYLKVMGEFDIQEVGMVLDRLDRFIAYSPDGFAGPRDEHGYGEILLEFKCPFGGKTEPNPRLYQSVPEYYVPQVQGGALTTLRKKIHFAAYVPEGWGQEIAVWEIEPSRDYQAVMREEMRKFYHHVLWHTDPGRTYTAEQKDASAFVKPVMPEVEIREIYRGKVKFEAAKKAGG